jgi:hypothetical protein
MSAAVARVTPRLTIDSSDRGCRLHWAKEGESMPWFDAGEAPRRSTSSLGVRLLAATQLVT